MGKRKPKEPLKKMDCANCEDRDYCHDEPMVLSAYWLVGDLCLTLIADEENHEEVWALNHWGNDDFRTLISAASAAAILSGQTPRQVNLKGSD